MKILHVLACLFITCMNLVQADSNPMMSRVYSAQFTPAVTESQSAATIGTVDTTFATSGYVSVNSLLSGSTAQAIQPLSNGNFLVVTSLSGSNTVVGEYNAQGVLQTTYGSSGITTLGQISTTNSLATMFDSQDRLLIAGANSTNTAGVIYRVPAAGSSSPVSTLVSDTNFTYIAGIAQQSTGQIIAVGYNGDNAQIARYNLNGSIDTTFGTSGYVVLDGTASTPTSPSGLTSVIIDDNNIIYTLFFDLSNAAYIAKLNASGVYQGTVNSSELYGLRGTTPAQSTIAFDVNGNIIIAALSAGGTAPTTPAAGSLYVTAITPLGAAVSGWSDYTSSSTNNVFGALFTSSGYGSTGSNGYVYLISSTNNSPFQQKITRLMGNGLLDSSANDTSYNFNSVGFNQFNATTDTAVSAKAGCLALNGQIYVCGSETVTGPTTTPYVYRLNNNQYVSQVAQFPAAQEQGILDQAFGNAATESYAGVVTPFNGLYGSSLQQKAQAVIEVVTTSGAGAGVPAIGEILVGMNGFTNTSNASNMMFSWLDASGLVDTSIGNAGYLTLSNVTSSNEYLTSIVQGPAGIVYLTGYASASLGGTSTQAMIRAYTTSSTTTWTAGASAWNAAQTGSGYQGTGLVYQSSADRILLCVGESATVGHITAYTSSGSVDTTFGAASSGTINSTSYGLNMGPCYGGLITGGDQLVVAYKDSSDNTVRSVAFTSNGSSLVSSWGTAGISQALFGGSTIAAANNIRTCFNQNDDVVVATTNGGSLLFTLLDGEFGTIDTNFGTAGVLTVAVNNATLLQLQQIVGVSDGTALATFYDQASDDTMYLARITLTGALDTTFNSQGAQPGILPIQIGNQVSNYNARIVTSALVQSTEGANQGNIILAGYESVTSSDATPIVMRVYGEPDSTEIPYAPIVNTNIPGTFDIAYDISALVGTGSGNAIFVYPGGNTYQGYILVGTDTGTDSKVARIDITSNTLDTSFGTAGVYTLTGLSGISTITLDANNSILVGGTTTGGTAWAQQLSASATSAVSFTLPSSFTQVNKILQQKSGRYIVTGKATIAGPSNVGIVTAFQDKVVAPASTLVVDPTFNPLSVNSAPAGSYYLGTTGIYNSAINTDDTIYVAYANVATPAKVVLTRLTADGSGIVTDFNSGVAVTTTLSTDGSAVCQLNIDSSSNAIIATSYNSGGTHQVQAIRYTSAGAVDTTWNSTGAVQTISNLGTAGVTLTNILETTSGKTVLIGYNTAGGNGNLFEARLTSGGVLDSTWNPSPSGTDTQGVLTYATTSATQLNASGITISGLIVSAASQSSGTSGNPVLTYVAGDTYVTQQSQAPLESAAGILDLTLPNGSTGSMSLSGIVTGVPQKVYPYNSTVNSSPNGAILVGSVSGGTTVYVTELNSDLSLNSNFGTAGVISFTPNASLTPTAVTITDIYVANGTNDTAMPIYVTGYTTTTAVNTMFAARIASDGSSSTLVTPTTTLSTTASVRQSINSRVLVAGYNGSNGTVVAYNSDMTAIDTSFGNEGFYTTSTANPIAAMAVDDLDRIYIAYQLNSSTVNVDRLLANGTIIDATFGTAGTVTLSGSSLSTTQIALAIDLTSQQLTIAATDGASTSNTIRLSRVDLSTGASSGTANISITGSQLNLANIFLDNDDTGSAYANIYVAGYISAGTNSGNAIVARIATTSSTIALDTTYAASSSVPGVANVTAGSMTVVTAGMLDLDRRVYFIGYNGGTGYIARLFGDYYWNQLSPAIPQALVGAIDTTLFPNYTGGIDLSGQGSWSSLATGYRAYAMIESPTNNGTSLIAFGDGTNLIVGKVDADMNPINAFGGFSANGLTTALAMSTVNSITIDALQNIIVTGANSGAQKVVLLNSSGTSLTTFAAPTLSSTVGTGIGQQKSGRYIVGSFNNGTTGMLTAYQNPSAISGGVLPIDSTFGPNGLAGYYATGVNTQIDDLVIDSQDYIYLVYRYTNSHIYLEKITANGSGKVSASNSPVAFNSGNAIDTGIVATQTAHIAINAAGNILVGSSTSSGIYTSLYDGSTGALIAGSTQVTSSSSDILTKLVGSITSNNEFYGSISNVSSNSGRAFAITSAGILDTVFGTNGIATTTEESVTSIFGLTLQFDGKVVLVGSGFSNSTPVLFRFYGYPYITQYLQAPSQASTGTLDTTLWPTVGALELSTYTPISQTITTLTGSRLKRIYEYSNGKALLVSDNANSGSDTVLMRINKDLTLDTTFNGTGFVTIAGRTNATSLFVDSNSNIYVAGGVNATSWLRAYSNSGATKSGWSTPVSNLTNGASQVGVQSVTRVILSGKGATNGTLYGYTTAGILDTSFGAAGVVNMGSTDLITDFAIDQYDNMITVANNSGTVVLKKVSASGLSVATLSGGTAISTAVSGSSIKNCLDQSGYIIVAAATSTGFIVRSYNNDGTGTNNASAAVTITAGSTSPAWVIANIYATSDGKITLIGYDSASGSTTAGQIMVARLVSGSGSLTLDTTTFNTNGTSPSGAGYIVTAIGSLNVAYDGIIDADDRIMIAGSNSSSAEPYLGRIFGDNYVSYVSQGRTQGVAGTLNTTFGNTTPPNGSYSLSTLNGILTGAQGKAIFPLSDGGYYLALDNANTAANSVLVKVLANGTLDTSYNSNGIASAYAPLGVQGILQDGSGNIVLLGSTGGAAWVKRYTSEGVADSTFNTAAAGALVSLSNPTAATIAVEQTLARLVVAGSTSAGNAGLFAFESLSPNGTPGTLDTTFNSTSLVPGSFDTGVSGTMSNLIADSYDRLIFAILNAGQVNVYRLTPTGELDLTFGSSNGIKSGVITNAAGASSVRIAFDVTGNIVVASNSSTTNTVSVNTIDNGTSITLGANGQQISGWNSGSQLNITNLTNTPSVTNLVTSADGYVLVLGTQSGTNPAWIARITSVGALDTAFNPDGSVGSGIFTYSLGGGTTAHVYNGLAVNQNGTINMIGYENSSSAYTPLLVSVYDDPYTSQSVQSPNSKAVGSNDLTLGVSPTSVTNKGITFYGVSGGAANYGQVARAVGLYDDNNIVVALDGGATTAGASQIFMNMFDNDGLLYNESPAFGTGGQATVLSTYEIQHVQDMVTFQTTEGIHKAILAGYVNNTTLNTTSSLLLQYILTPGSQALDIANFGGYQGSQAGIAFGDGQALYAVGQQSNGRIIASGMSQDSKGLLLGYTAAGKLDNSFGNNGYQVSDTGSQGIYTHAIDTNNRIVIAYNNAGSVTVVRFLADGSGVDTSFDASASYIATVSSSTNMKVAVDSSNNVYAAAATASGNWIVVSSYDQSTGNLLLNATITGNNLGNPSAVYTMSKLIIDASGKILVVAYDSDAQQIVVMRLTSGFGLDTTFNGTGYITYAVASGSTQVATDAIIHPDGRIIVVGSEN